jgi:hypothetical protein
VLQLLKLGSASGASSTSTGRPQKDQLDPIVASQDSTHTSLAQMPK